MKDKKSSPNSMKKKFPTPNKKVEMSHNYKHKFQAKWETLMYKFCMINMNLYFLRWRNKEMN